MYLYSLERQSFFIGLEKLKDSEDSKDFEGWVKPMEGFVRHLGEGAFGGDLC